MIIKRSSNNIKLIESKLPAEWKKFRKVQKEVNSKYPRFGADVNVPSLDSAIDSIDDYYEKEEILEFLNGFIPESVIIIEPMPRKTNKIITPRTEGISYDFKKKTWILLEKEKKNPFNLIPGKQLSWNQVKQIILDEFLEYLNDWDEYDTWDEDSSIVDYLKKSIEIIKIKL